MERSLRSSEAFSTHTSASLQAGWKSKRGWIPNPPREKFWPRKGLVRRDWAIRPKNHSGVRRGRPHPPRRTEPQRRGRAERLPPPTQRPPRASPPPPEKEGDWQLANNRTKKKRERRKKERGKKEKTVKKTGPSGGTPGRGEQKKAPKRRPAVRFSDAIRISAKDGQPFADILKDMKAQVNPTESILEVLSVRRTRKEEILLVLKKGGDIPAFKKPLDQAVGASANVRTLVTTKVVEIRDIDETTTREEVAAALSKALGREELGVPCRLYSRFGGVRAAVVQLAETDAKSLLQLGRIRLGWVNCRIREHV